MDNDSFFLFEAPLSLHMYKIFLFFFGNYQELNAQLTFRSIVQWVDVWTWLLSNESRVTDDNRVCCSLFLLWIRHDVKFPKIQK